MAQYSVPGGFGISRQSFDEVDNLIRSMQRGTREFTMVMDLAAQMLAKTSQGLVQQKYRGPTARARSGGADYERSSWALPVRRITGRTLAGWKVRRISTGAWELFNEERGAYMVEYGIVRGGHGVARKPLKLSAVATLRFIQRTRFGQRVMAETFGNLRTNKGHFRSFSARMAGSNLMGVSGPSGDLP